MVTAIDSSLLCEHTLSGAIAVISLLSGGVIDRMAIAYETRPVMTNGTFSNATMSEAVMRDKYRVVVACSLSLLVGVIQVIMGFSGLGIVTSYFSDTFISSYTSGKLGRFKPYQSSFLVSLIRLEGSAIHVLVSQIKDLFGMKGTVRYEGMLKIPKVRLWLTI